MFISMSHEFDRTGNTSFFLKDGRGDGAGAEQYVQASSAKLVDIRKQLRGAGISARSGSTGGGFAKRLRVRTR